MFMRILRGVNTERGALFWNRLASEGFDVEINKDYNSIA